MFAIGDKVVDLYNVVNRRAVDDTDIWDVILPPRADYISGPFLEIQRYEELDDVVLRESVWPEEYISLDVARRIATEDSVWAEYAAPIAEWSAVVARALKEYRATLCALCDGPCRYVGAHGKDN